MKGVLIAAAMLFAAPVFAGPDSRVVDDYIACLIGQSAVALKAGAADATAAQQLLTSVVSSRRKSRRTRMPLASMTT